MTPKLRTIFYHSSLAGGQKTVKNPAGWKKTIISLERSETYHSLIEQFKASNLWYGNARETLLAIQASDGPNAEVRVTLEVKWSELGAYEFIFDGLIKLAQFEEIFTGIKSNKLNAPIIRDGFWSKFHNRYDRPVNLEGTTDLDGGTRAAVNKTSVLMRGQIIDSNVSAKSPDYGEELDFNDSSSTNQLFQFSWNTIEVNELGLFTLPQSLTTNLVNQIEINKDGEYEFDIKTYMYLPFFATSPDQLSNRVRVYIKKNDETPILLTEVYPYLGLNDGAFYEDVILFSCVIGDKITIYGDSGNYGSWPSTSGIGKTLWWNGVFDEVPLQPEFVSHLKINGKTTFPDTTTDAYLIKEAAQSIISKYVGADSPLISTKFSNTTFNRNAIFRGKHNRGYSFSEKEMSMSFKNWWEAANPAFNLCLGYTKVSGADKIYIEDKSYAYNPTPIVNLPNARNLVRRYDLEKFFSSIEFGFEKWSAESASGIDDHQTKRIYNTNIKTFGQDFKNLSKFFCAALGIEQSRRNRVELGKDDRLDEELMMVSVIPDGSDWQLEFDENFDNVNNVLNPDKRANLRHSAVRLFKRWQNFYNPSLKTSESFTFGRGEGNYDAQTRLDPADYEATANPDELVDEKGNRQANGARLWVPVIWELQEYEMRWTTYKQIRDNKENAVGLSRTEADFAPMFIVNLDFEMFNGKSSMILLQATDATP